MAPARCQPTARSWPSRYGSLEPAEVGRAAGTALCFEGCEHIDTYLDREGSRALLVEKWAAPEHQQAYLAWRVENGFLDQWGAFASDAADIVTWEIASDV